TTALPSAPSSQPATLRAESATSSTTGSPKAAMCATKLRLPKVPPGARLIEKKSVSTPYVCASDVAQPTTTAKATAASRRDRSPAAATARATMNTATDDAVIAAPRRAFQ